MKLYRLLTGSDDASFCHRISGAVSNGWSLHGSPVLTYDPEKKQVVCGQAVVKEVDGEDYRPGIKLSDY